MTKKYKILYVDDELSNLRVFNGLYRRKYNIVTATNAIDALRLFDQDTYHLVVSDQRMPNMTGLEFLANIKKREPQIPTILLTGYTDYGVLQEAFNESKVHKFINKPYDPQNLGAILDLSIEGFILAKEKAKMQEELAVSEDKFRGIFNSMADVFMRVCLNGTIKVISPSIYELTGYTQDELLGSSIEKLYADAEERKRVVRITQKMDYAGEIECTLRTKSGELKHVSFTTKILRDAENKPIGIEKIARDITEKKRMEQTVKEQNDLLEETQKIAQVGSWQYDVKYDRAIWSDTLCDIYGIDGFEDVENTLESYMNFFHPREQPKVRRIISKALESLENFSFDATIVRTDGAERQISYLGKVVSDEKKQITKITVACLDITQSKLKENELKRSEEKFRVLTEQLPIRAMKIDRDLNIVYCNTLMENCILTANREESSVHKFLHKKALPTIFSIIKTVFNDRESSYTEFQFSSTWFGLIASIIKSPNGTESLLLLFNDITEKKESERLLKNLNEELEKKVAERTTALEAAKDNIEKAYQKEKQLSQLKTQFVSTASHQFRTPLTVIQSNIGLLHMQAEQTDIEFKTKFERVYKRIESEVKRMTDLMDNVLILGKKESGAVEAKPELIDVLSLITKIVKKHNDIQADKRKAKVTHSGSPTMYNLDPDLLENAVSNLLSNAFKYSESKPAPLVNLQFNESNLKIFVQDFGIGIPKESLPHLFDPFYRAENVKDISGTGLGTSIVKAYVELMQGIATVTSELNKGSTFIINFEK